jgi:F0F1-type ATP synthase assembly protein I
MHDGRLMIKNLLDANDEPKPEPPAASSKPAKKEVIGLFDSDDIVSDSTRTDEPFILSQSEPESIAETARRSGLAWSMGVVFFVSVAFLLVLGWGADLLFGSSPWGIVLGVVIGALIGFYQLFRLSSQIFKK